jgi:hypothetical protein
MNVLIAASSENPLRLLAAFLCADRGSPGLVTPGFSLMGETFWSVFDQSGLPR